MRTDFHFIKENLKQIVLTQFLNLVDFCVQKFFLMEEYIDSDSNTSFNCGQINGPYVKIIEQPAKCGVRFRYECEGRISGAIPGSTATTISPTYPTIKIFNYEGRAKVIVSCITKSNYN
jgi:hypothetical protein